MGDGLAVGIALTTDPERSRSLLEDFCRCLEQAAGVRVTAHGMWHYHHLLEALSAGQLDLVWLPPILALRATSRAGCIPIAIPIRHGVSTYSSALFTRPGSAYRTIADLRGARAAWVDRQSAAGYLIIRALLRSKGVDLAQAFTHEKFLGTHDAVAGAVLDGEVDVGATFVYLDEDLPGGARFPRSAGWGSAEVHIICHAGSIPSDMLAVKNTLPEPTVQLIQRALIELRDPELARAARNLLGAEGFVAPDERHLERLLHILDHLEDDDGPAHTQFPPPERG
jgi:phosphonate transport system substrate-binding protein